MPSRVLMVCLGNICRSPTAHGVVAHKVIGLGLQHRIEVDSAGTSNWHVGSAPDNRSIRAAHSRGYDLRQQRGRQVRVDDFDEFDFILAMDAQNLAHLETLKPQHFSGHLGLFLDFHPQRPLREVPDPYHGGEPGFLHVLDLVEATCDALINHIVARP